MNSDSDTAASLALLERLLGEWGIDRPQLLPAQLPANLPIELPLPDGARLVGSAAWSGRATILFDSSLTAEQIIKFYEDILVPKGGIKPDVADPFGRGGFAHGGMAGQGSQFCQGERGPWLSIRTNAERGAPGAAHVTVYYNGTDSPCSPRQRRKRLMNGDYDQILPILQPPEGATQMGGGGGGESESVSSRAWLETKLDLPTLLPHYNDQLRQAGWSLIDSASSGPVGWSTWDFKYEGDNWHGLLTIIGQPWAPGQFRLALSGESEGYGRHGGIVWRHG